MINRQFRFSILLIGTVMVSLGLGPAKAHATTAVFNFDTDTLGTFTPFTDNNSGLSATFSSNGDPGGFTSVPVLFKTLTGNVLIDPGPAFKNNLDLIIVFSLPVSSFSMEFALNTSDPSVPIMGSFSNGSSFSATGAVPAGFNFPEGGVSLSFLTPFITVTLSSTALDFAVDNITVGIASTGVPEPTTLPLLGSGLAGLGGIVWRRNRKPQ